MTDAALVTPPDAEEVDPPLTSEDRDEVRQLEAAVRLARFMTSPVDFISEDYCQLAPLDAEKLRRLAAHEAFRKPLNRALALQLDITGLTISEETISRLARSPELRLATLILASPLNDIRNVALMMTAAVLSSRVRNLILKRDRSAAQEALGLIGFDIAIHEAPLLYPLLAALDRTPADYPLFQSELPLDQRQESASQLGFMLVGRFFDSIEPVFAELFSYRLPSSAGFSDRADFIADLNEAHCRQLLRLIRRRQRTWSDIIG